MQQPISPKNIMSNRLKAQRVHQRSRSKLLLEDMFGIRLMRNYRDSSDTEPDPNLKRAPFLFPSRLTSDALQRLDPAIAAMTIHISLRRRQFRVKAPIWFILSLFGSNKPTLHSRGNCRDCFLFLTTTRKGSQVLFFFLNKRKKTSKVLN